MSDIGGIEQVTLVAELTIDLDVATVFDHQALGIFLAQTDQRIGRTFARAAATEAQALRIEQTNLLFVVQAMEHGFVVQAEQFIGGQGAGQRRDVLPAGRAFFFVFETVGGQLLQQQTTGATAIGVQPERVPTCWDMTK